MFRTATIVIICVTSYIICAIDKNTIKVQSDNISMIIEFASNITNKWNFTQKTMIIIDLADAIFTRLTSDVAVAKYSMNYETEVLSEFSCDENNRVEFHPTTMLMILEDNESKLNECLEKHYKWTNYKEGTLLILHPIKIVSYAENIYWLKRLFRKCWARNIVAVLVVYWSKTSLVWFTFNGFKDELHNNTGKYDFTDLLANISLDLYGYKLRSCFVHDPPASSLKDIGNGTYVPQGIDNKAFEVIAKVLNISNHSIKPFMPNMDHMLAIEEYAKNKKCDVLFSSSTKFGTLRGMANLYPLYEDYLCVMAPKSKQYTGLEKLMLPFQSTVWYAVISSFSAIFIYWQLITSLRLPWRLSMDDHYLIVDYLFGLILNLSHPIPFQNLTQSSRVLVVSVGFFGLLLSFIYQCLLFGYLTVPIYYEDIHTLNEVGSSGISILAPDASLRTWLKMNSSKEYPKEFMNSIKGVSNLEFTNLINTNNNSFGYLLRKTTIAHTIIRNKMGPVFHQVEECLQPLLRTYIVACNFPFSSRINEITQWLKQAGLPSHWKMLLAVENLPSNLWDGEDEEDTEYEPKAFPLNTLTGLIKLWIVGLSVSSFTLILEFFWSKMVTQQLHK